VFKNCFVFAGELADLGLKFGKSVEFVFVRFGFVNFFNVVLALFGLFVC